MTFALWSSTYETGHPEVDRQHQRLFSMINEFHEAMSRHQGREILGPLLGDLAAYTLEHFAAEEALMRENGFPDLERHQLLHAELAQQVNDYLLRFSEGYFTLPTTLARFLANWLKQHIRKEDVAFIAWLNAP
jgi:hemerythrin